MSNLTSPNIPTPSPHQSRPTISTTLHPATFDEMIEVEAGPLWSHNLNTHWSLEKQIDTTHYLTLCGWLLHKLNTSNYISWTVAAESSLDTIDLGGYINGNIMPHTLLQSDYSYWWAANALIQSILVTNMSEEIVVQVSHLKNMVDIWKEAKCLFAGRTVTDFTLTITSLVTTKYVDGKDIPAHIAKMKGFWCDLTLMGKDLDNGLFGCFLRISMPPTWNYIFAGLPNDYMSAKVKQWIKDEYGIKVNQETLAMAYQAGQRQGRAKPGNVVCKNCKCPGYLKAKCWLPGGGAEGKGPNHKKKKKRQSKKQKEDEKKKSKHRANQAISNESDLEEEVFMVTTPVHCCSCFHWILDGGATTHICTNWNLFIMFTKKWSYIGGIQKNAPTVASSWMALVIFTSLAT